MNSQFDMLQFTSFVAIKRPVSTRFEVLIGIRGVIMKLSVLIITLVSIFTYNTFALETLSGDAKIHFPNLNSLELPISQTSASTQAIQCKFEGDRQPSSLNNSSWNIIANGANFEKRTITFFNSASNEVLLMNCYKLSPDSPRKTTAVSDAQIIELLKASQIKFI